MGEVQSRLSGSVKYHPVQSRRKVGRVLKPPLELENGRECHSESNLQQRGSTPRQPPDFLQTQSSGNNQSHQSTSVAECNDGGELNPLTRSIHEDFRISRFVLGIGITGKVVECTEKRTNRRCALKVCVKFLVLHQIINW